MGFICKRATAQLETYTCATDASKSCKTISAIATDKKADNRVDNTVRRRHIKGDIKCKYIQEKEKKHERCLEPAQSQKIRKLILKSKKQSKQTKLTLE